MTNEDDTGALSDPGKLEPILICYSFFGELVGNRATSLAPQLLSSYLKLKEIPY
jgi:hypothetical protein